MYDSTGTIQKYYDYDPYGKLVRAGGNPDLKYKFTGQLARHASPFGGEYDGETFLYNFRARNYDDKLAIFNAIDPAEKGFSPYSYAVGNPIMFVDPDGRDTLRFNFDGSYTGKVVADKTGKYYGQILDRDGKVARFVNFLDPSDAQSIMSTRNSDGSLRPQYDENGNLNWKPNGDGLQIVGLNLEYEKSIDQYVESNVSTVEAMTSAIDNVGLKIGIKLAYIKEQSMGGGEMDYLFQRTDELKSIMYVQGESKTIFTTAVIGDMAYNNADAGNYMWGKTIAAFGSTPGLAQMAAQIYERFISGHNKWDQNYDQIAIKNGARSYQR